MRFTRSLPLLAVVAMSTHAACAHEAEVPAARRAAPSETLAPRLQMPLPNVEGKTFTSVVVTFPPGAKAVPHRHGEAFVYAYVLSGSVRSQLDEQPAKVYRTGDDWYEPPGARHKVTENTSRRQPARLLVVFVAPTGATLKSPE